MQDLRLVAANESGTHLVLRSQVGEKYLLAIDERLRAAVRGDRARLGQLEIESDGQLRPRDIQAQIRAGATAEQVAQAAGVPVDRVRRFEGPVLAEREHMAQMAQRGTVRRPGQIDARGITLGEAVTARMDPLKIKPDELAWDSWRRDDGRWLVQLTYDFEDESRRARFVFDFRARTIAPEDDEARWIVAELEQRPQRAPFVPRLAGAPDKPSTSAGERPQAERLTDRKPPVREDRPAGSGVPAAMRGDHPAGRKRLDRGEAPRPPAALPAPAAVRPAAPPRPAPEIVARPSAPAPRPVARPAAPAAKAGPGVPARSAPAGDPPSTARPAATAPAARAAVPPSVAAPPEAPRPRRVAPLDFLVPPVPGDVPSPVRREPSARPSIRRPGIRSDALGPRTQRRSVLDVPAVTPAATAGTEPVEHRRTGTSDARPAPTSGSRRRASVPSWDDIMFGTRRRD